MINLRNFFKRPFQNKTADNAQYQRIKMLNGYSPYILADNNNIYDNLLIRSCIDTIAKHGAKLSAKVISPNGSYKNRLEYLLTYRPNEYMNGYEFLYKIISHYFTNK